MEKEKGSIFGDNGFPKWAESMVSISPEIHFIENKSNLFNGREQRAYPINSCNKYDNVRKIKINLAFII